MKKKYVIIFIIVMFLGWILGSFILCFLLIKPCQSIVENPIKDNKVLTIEKVVFKTDDSINISAWYVTTPVRSNTAVIIAHELDGNRNTKFNRAQFYLEKHMNVLSIDLRGHGESNCKYRSFGWYERKDIIAAYTYLKQKGNDAIAFHGISLGASAGLFSAEQCTFDFVVLESPYDGLVNALNNRFHHFLLIHPPKFMLFPLFFFAEMFFDKNVQEISPIEYAKYLNCPVFYIAGEKEYEVTAKQTQNIFNMLATSHKTLWIVKNAGHVDHLNHFPQKYRKKINTFLDELK